MKFIAGGKPGGDVLGLFLSDEIRQLLAEVREDYDLILLDAPPVEAMTEARVAAVAGRCHAVMRALALHPGQDRDCMRWRCCVTPTPKLSELC